MDHRFQAAFREFITNELGIEFYNPVAIAGGALAIGSENYSFFGYIWNQIEYFVRQAGLKKLVLINHEDCKWYEYEHPDFSASELKSRGRSDLQDAVQNIKTKYPSVEIIIAWAWIKEGLIKFAVLE